MGVLGEEDMEKINEQITLLQEQNTAMKTELQDFQSKIVSLEEVLTHRSTQLSKLEDEGLENKIKCRTAEEELSSYKAKVGALEEELAKTKIRTLQVEREFLKSKERIMQLEKRSQKLEAINDLLEKLKDDSTFKKFVESECKKHKAQAAKEEEEPIEVKVLELPTIEGEDSLNEAFLKCQKLINERKILLCETDLINAMAHETKAGLDKGAAWNLCEQLVLKLEGPAQELLNKLNEGEDYATTTAKNELIKICRKFFVDETKFFYVKDVSESSTILAITNSMITEMDFKNKEVRRKCKVDDIREIQLKDPDNLQLVVKRKSNSWKSKCLDIWIYSSVKRQEILDAIYGIPVE